MKIFIFALVVAWTVTASADWPGFRGPDASSVAANADLPVQWSEEQNIAWRTELPGRGVSCPVIVGERIYLTATTGFREARLHVLCYDAKDGHLRWQRQYWATGRTATHESVTGATPTCASDGRHVVAFFSSNDLICLDLEGNPLWFRGLSYDYPKAGNDIGMASSPAIADGVVVVQVENMGESFVAGIDVATGMTKWRIDRTLQSNWSSPTVMPGQGERQAMVVLQSPTVLTGHDIQTGQELWRMEGTCGDMCSPTPSGKLLFAPMEGLTAFRFSNQSSAPERYWNAFRLRPGASSPVIQAGRVYTLSGTILKCAEASTGDLLWQLRLKGRFWATPVVVGNRLYCVNYDGVVYVIELGQDEGTILAENAMGQLIHASPAVAGNALYLRCDRYLWKIAKP